MKKDTSHAYSTFKIIQLILTIVLFAAFFLYLRTDPSLSNNIFTNKRILTICVFLWAFMIFSFVAIIVDFKQLDKNISDSDDLSRLAYLDMLTGIPNRISCDLIFQQYENVTADEIKDLACALISITNLSIINEALGREKGNFLIQDFASLFEEVGSKYGFVGRNGGNEFLIVIEKCGREKMQRFIDDFASSVKYYNDNSNHLPVTYRSHAVFNTELNREKFSDIITQLYKERG